MLVRSRSPVVALGDGRAEGWVKPTSEMPLHLGIMRQMEREGDSAHTFALRHRVRGCTPGHLVRVQRERRGLADRILVTKPYAAPGSTEWAEAAIESFVRQPGSRAVLLANHGVVAIGTPSKMRVWWPPKSSGPPRSLAWLACLAGGSS